VIYTFAPATGELLTLPLLAGVANPNLRENHNNLFVILPFGLTDRHTGTYLT